MRVPESRLQERQLDVAATELADRIAALFAHWPMLCGFSVRGDPEGAEADLCITDVSVLAWPGLEATRILREEIADAMIELLDEQPEAYDLVRDRTFARTLQ